MIQSNIVDPKSERAAKILAVMPDVKVLIKWQEEDPDNRCEVTFFSNFKEVPGGKGNCGATGASCLGSHTNLLRTIAVVLSENSDMRDLFAMAIKVAEDPLVLTVTKQLVTGELTLEDATEIISILNKGKEAKDE